MMSALDEPLGYRERVVDRAQAHRDLDRLFDILERTEPFVRRNEDGDLHIAGPKSRRRADEELAACYWFAPDPQQEGPRERRYLDACQALYLSARLIKESSQWAMNYLMGHALSVPPVGQREGLAVPAEDWRLEELGARYNCKDPVANRRLIRELLMAMPEAFPWPLMHGLLGALTALEYGEVRPIITPAKTGMTQPALTRAMHELHMLELVEFRVAAGQRRRKALDRVADAFSVSPDTLESWRKKRRQNLDRKLGARLVQDALARAKQDGRRLRECFNARHTDAYERLLAQAIIRSHKQAMSLRR